MNGDFGQDEKYYATSIAHPEYASALRQVIAEDNPLLPVVERLTTHVGALQDKVVYCRSRGDFCECACACDYDDPGDVCATHGKVKVMPAGVDGE